MVVGDPVGERAVATPVNVLLVETDPETVAMAVGCLTRAGFEMKQARSGAEALRWIEEGWADLVVYDPHLPGEDWGNVGRMAAISEVPLIMVSPRGDWHERILGLGLGADDFLTSPLSAEELVYRVRAVLRRTHMAPIARDRGVPRRPVPGEDLIAARSDAALVLDPGRRRACVFGTWVALSGIEFRLLSFLDGHPGMAFARQELLERVWGYTVGSVSTVTVHVRRLREKIEYDPAKPAFVLTVWGIGYCLDPTGGGRDRQLCRATSGDAGPQTREPL